MLAVAVAQAAGAVDFADVRVEKAQGKDARTVAELYASKASLKGAEVLVRGRVVKWNAEILGKNWIHLRDGSGSAEKKDNDITVTTGDVVAKGDVITVRGKVACDKDFTAGYVYPVIIEDASRDDLEMATRYLGPKMGAWYAENNPSTEEAVVVTITPENWRTMDFGKLMSAGG